MAIRRSILRRERQMNAETIAYTISGSTAVIVLQNPPVNSPGWGLRHALVEGIDRANADVAVESVVLLGSGAGFSGGADLGEFGTPRATAQPDLLSVIDAVEGSGKPVIAAIHGVCMGGGLELALGCHSRVTVVGAKIALPEVKLGLLPGAAGRSGCHDSSVRNERSA
jgi:3-hydroxyacyl-CoA dehydrogenase